MSETAAEPPVIAPPAPAPAPAEPSRASDCLVAPTESSPSTGGESPTTSAEPAEPGAAVSTETSPSSSEEAAPAPEAAPPAPAPGDVRLAARLATIAKANRKLELASKELEARQRAYEVRRKALERYEKVDAAGTRLDKLRALTDGSDAELEAMFWDLNAHILEQTKPKTQEDIVRLAEDRAVARVRAEAETAAKASAEAAKTTYETAKATAERAYLDRARGAIDSVADAIPTVMRGLASGKVAERDILDYVEAVFADTGKVVPPEDVLRAFEAHMAPSKKPVTAAIEAPAPKQGPVITAKMMGNAPLTRWDREMTQSQSWEEAKRAAGIIK